MKTSTILTTLTTLLTPTLSSPLTIGWSITNYQNGCSPGGCAYSFSIAWGPTTTVEPDFSTTCTGVNVRGPGAQQPCANTNIKTNSIPGLLNETIYVSHVFYQGDVRYNVTGNATLGTPLPGSFVVMQSEISAVL